MAVTPFPQILSKILADESHSDIISWLPHGKGFILQDKKRFADEVMPRYFNDAKFTSFTRRLNRWCFIHRPKGNCESQYFHPLFVQGDRKKLFEMNPKPQVCYKKKKKKKTTQSSMPDMQSHQKLLQPVTNLISNFPGLVPPGMGAVSATRRLLDRWPNRPTPLNQPSFASMPSLNNQIQLNRDEGNNFKGSYEDEYASSSRQFLALPEREKSHFASTGSASKSLNSEARTSSSPASNLTARHNGYSGQIGTSTSPLDGMNNLASFQNLVASLYAQKIYNDARQQTAPYISSNDALSLMMLQNTRQQANALLMNGGGIHPQSYSPNPYHWSRAMMQNSPSCHNQGNSLREIEESLKLLQASGNKRFVSPQSSGRVYKEAISPIDDSRNRIATLDAQVSPSPANVKEISNLRS